MKPKKDRRTRGSVLPVLLMLLAAAGAGAAAWEAWNLTIDDSPIAVQAAAAGTAATLASVPAAGETGVLPASYAETLARPLFNPTRRPIVAAKPKVVEQPPPPPVQPLQAQLVGLAMGAKSGGRALVRSANERSASWLSVGEELGGWRLSEIASDRVVFMSGEGRQELHLVAPRTKAVRQQ